MYNISRTTVRHTLAHLSQCGVLEKVGDDYVILRRALPQDGFDCQSLSLDEQGKKFEKAFYQMINKSSCAPAIPSANCSCRVRST
jgi:GntR family transcriptional regulator, transcriptional activator for L-galactonate catabolism